VPLRLKLTFEVAREMRARGDSRRTLQTPAFSIGFRPINRGHCQERFVSRLRVARAGCCEYTMREADTSGKTSKIEFAISPHSHEESTSSFYSDRSSCSCSSFSISFNLTIHPCNNPFNPASPPLSNSSTSSF